MTITLDAPAIERTTVASLLAERLSDLGERIDRDGIDTHAVAVARLADAVRPRSAALADVLTGPYLVAMRERAFGRAVRLVMLRPAEHAALALDLSPAAA